MGVTIVFLYLILANFYESPRFYYDKARFKEAREVLNGVAKYNGVKDYP